MVSQINLHDYDRLLFSLLKADALNNNEQNYELINLFSCSAE